MKWLEKKVTIYNNCFDVRGRAGTHEEVLFWGFEKNLPAIVTLRRLDINSPGYKEKKDKIKDSLIGCTPAALLASREKDNVIIIERTGLMQLDFDYCDIKDYHIEELKRAVFKLPFIAFCGLSCTGTGFYALVQIAEPERLKEYAQHCFRIFKECYGIKLDVSKGGNVAHLRYLSYDANMLVRESPETLHIPKIQQEIRNKRYYNGFDPFAQAMRTAEAKTGRFIHGTNGHNFIYIFCRSLKGLNVSQIEATQWIDRNLISSTQIKSNCIKAAFA